MNSTIVIAELITAGLFGLASIFLLLIHPAHPDVEAFIRKAVVSEKTAVIASGFVVFVAYYLGWIINGIAYELQDRVFGKGVKDGLLKQHELKCKYREVNVAAFQNVKEYMMNELAVDRAVMRLSRCSILVFPFLALGLWWDFNLWGVSLLIVGLIGLCIYQLRNRALRYYETIFLVAKGKVPRDPTPSEPTPDSPAP